MFDLYDLEINDDKVHDVQTQMTKLVNGFFEKHRIDALAQPDDWADDQYSTMIIYGYMGAINFAEFGYEEFDGYWERRFKRMLTSEEQAIASDFDNMLFELERLYCSLNRDD